MLENTSLIISFVLQGYQGEIGDSGPVGPKVWLCFAMDVSPFSDITLLLSEIFI